MPIPTTCLNCEKLWHVKDELAATCVNCPACKREMRVPPLGDMSELETESPSKPRLEPSAATTLLDPSQISWFLVFVANLPVPLMFGLEATREGGRFGMCLAIISLWAVVSFACSREVRWCFTAGGFVVGLTQFIPFLQMMAGSVSLAVCSQAGLEIPRNAGFEHGFRGAAGLTELGGYTATILTGVQLMLLAFIIGMTGRFIGERLGG